ncbi:PfkB family carbohydrate kinase [Paracoccus panacisoli]|uniref:PfkB family carbohydrate kinase n=1 Tax=Paracoccus panacisoli TaxID=1510163 RepID=A0ABV6T4S2_9RHOB
MTAGALDRAFAEAATLYLSGITVAILPPEGRDRLAVALARASEGGARVVFDPNLRPRLWEDAATMRAQITRFAGLSDLILPSFDDEAAQFGDEGPPATIARYLDAGAGTVVVKAAGAPVHYGWADGAGVVADLPRATPVDSTAAGDSFNAGYLAAALQGQPPEAAIRAGHTLALRVIAHRGALVPL